MARSATKITEGVVGLGRAETAKQNLIEAGLKIFSEVGYEGASTRSLATAANVNIAAITYYFRSKKGLYHAVIDHIIACYKRELGGELGKIKQALADTKATSKDCYALFNSYMHVFLHFALQQGQERSHISHLYIREQLDPTSAFDLLYQGFIRDMHETIAALVGRMIGTRLTVAEIKILTQTLLGQVIVFKSSREAILHNMRWKNYGGKGIQDIERLVMFNLHTLIQAYRRGKP